MPEENDPLDPQQPPERSQDPGAVAPDDPEPLSTQTWDGPEANPTLPASRPKIPETPPNPSPHRSGWQAPTPEELQPSFPQYEIVGVLGRGGMGAVYKGWQKSLHRFVAIKILPPQLEASETNFAERFQREAQAMARFTHPNIVAVHDAGETPGGLLYFIMEYVEGTDVQRMVAAEGKLSPEHAIAIASHVCDALASAHKRGVIHRDIKPSNIMVDAEGQVKVADFGLAKVANDTAIGLTTGSHVSMGTPDFMAPEAMLGMEYVDHRADLYAVGVMLYQMLTGEMPRGIFEMPSAQTPGLDPRFDAVVARALQKNPDKRYSSAVELRSDLDHIQSQPIPHTSAIAQPPPPAAAPHPVLVTTAPLTQPTPPQSRLPLFAGIGTAIALALGTLLYIAPWKKDTPGGAHSVVPPTSVGEGGKSVGAGSPVNRPPLVPSATSDKAAARPSANPPDSPPPPRPSNTSPATATKETPFENTLGMKFVPVPILGGPTGGQRVLFSIWDTRVQDYEAFAKETKREWPKPEFVQGPAHPAVEVSWEDGQAFCAWLTARERKAGKLSAKEVYRLPSDHEWSCAVGIGEREDALKLPTQKSVKIKDAFPWGTQWPPPAGSGNYAGEELRPGLAAGKYPYLKDVIDGYRDDQLETSPVGSFAANRFGLFDMGGNVWQWCEDWFDKEQKDRALRGASWSNENREALISSNRYHRAPALHGATLGFRCVLAPVSAPDTTSVPRAGNTPATATKDAPFENTLGMKFVPVPIHGGPTEGQRVLFSMWDTRVQDYQAHADAKQVDDSWTKEQKDGVPAGRELNDPVVGVSWEDAQGFCQWLTEKEITGGRLPKGLKYRLPTDEEWSWAVGLPPESGTTPAEKNQKNGVDFPWGKEFPPSQKVGNYADETFHAKFPQNEDAKNDWNKNRWLDGYTDGYATTSPVGSFPANAYGLYDMGGNVWQWCEDWLDASHKHRVLRGASWNSSGRGGLLSSNRYSGSADGHYGNNGFRCVLAPASPTP